MKWKKTTPKVNKPSLNDSQACARTHTRKHARTHARTRSLLVSIDRRKEIGHFTSSIFRRTPCCLATSHSLRAEGIKRTPLSGLTACFSPCYKHLLQTDRPILQPGNRTNATTRHKPTSAHEHFRQRPVYSGTS